ncbi:DUF1493 family protein [Pseudomonas sp. NFR16]|uniref:DUF1493 family protein n=1 Tax=Pseudomonas sp. NFR16 TaxID=1566248 RepID=UPI0008C0EAED|nr:DUF1493 family protein [Pseudomonas sp. NFR16]SEJ64843.1 Protein of unknown function [Pseudomonas sp. NFR16]
MNVFSDYKIMDSIVICIQDAVGFGRKAFETFSLATDIARDLGIDGDDSNELMVEFFDKFSIDLNDYDPYRYFLEEGFNFFSAKPAIDRRGNIPLRVGMLYLAVKAKRWDTQDFEKAEFSTAPLYERTKDIPIDGYKIKSRW